MKQLFVILLVILISCNQQDQKKQNFDWLFIYYMPYDNNLSDYGNEIINMLQEGLQTDNIAVVVHADFADSTGITRFVITNNGITESNIIEERSADTKVLSQYLNWIHHNFTADNYFVSFLNHGGKIDELCQDELPENKYLTVDSIAQELKVFNEKTGKKPELLFMQVCAKGAIEPVFELKDCAKFTMFSQNILGAPNYYYQNMLKSVSNKTAMKGEELAITIAENDRSDMYYSFTCVDNQKLDSFGFYFNKFIYSVQPDERFSVSIWDILEIEYGDQLYWDIVSLLNQLKTTNIETEANRQKLIDYLINEAVIFHKINPTNNLMKPYCGLSVLANDNENYYTLYNHLNFYKKVKIKGLMRKIKY